MDATRAVKADHKHVQELFRLFESTDDVQAKAMIIDEALATLESHAAREADGYYVIFGRTPAWAPVSRPSTNTLGGALWSQFLSVKRSINARALTARRILAHDALSGAARRVNNDPLLEPRRS